MKKRKERGSERLIKENVPLVFAWAYMRGCRQALVKLFMI